MGRVGRWALAGVVGLAVAGGGAWGLARFRASGHGPVPGGSGETARRAAGPKPGMDAPVRFTEAQQREIGLETAIVSPEAARGGLAAPGRIAPDETKFAYITPRTAGIVRSVAGQIGQEVRAGDVLATIDSVEVGEARLQLYTEEQNLQIAATQADWQETIYRNTLSLLDSLRRGDTPDAISRTFEGRPVGANRERLMTAYAQYRLANATIDRNRELDAQRLITPKQLQQVTADFDAARATYQALLEQMGFETRLDKIRAEQARRQAATALRVVRERLRIFGVQPSAGGRSDPLGSATAAILGTYRPESAEAPPPPPPGSAGDAPAADAPAGDDAGGATPASTYSLVAPFDGTLLDRELVVPGVAVDRNHRIFTLGDLSTVWVEANIHESDFAVLDRSRDGTVRFTTPAYPRREFVGRVLYSGDLVDEKSRTVKLLARAENPGRLLKPGMFVEVRVFSAQEHGSALQIPSGGLLSDQDRMYVYLRTSTEQFIRRYVDVEAVQGDLAVISGGLRPGDEVVTRGAFKLKAEALRRLE